METYEGKVIEDLENEYIGFDFGIGYIDFYPDDYDRNVDDINKLYEDIKRRYLDRRIRITFEDDADDDIPSDLRDIPIENTDNKTVIRKINKTGHCFFKDAMLELYEEYDKKYIGKKVVIQLLD